MTFGVRRPESRIPTRLLQHDQASLPTCPANSVTEPIGRRALAEPIRSNWTLLDAQNAEHDAQDALPRSYQSTASLQLSRPIRPSDSAYPRPVGYRFAWVFSIFMNVRIKGALSCHVRAQTRLPSTTQASFT
jgi:hypothetical protein